MNVIEHYGIAPESIENAHDLAEDYGRRVCFQADVQDFVAQPISGTINLRPWDTQLNNEVPNHSRSPSCRYAPHLRCFTCPRMEAGDRQPLSRVPHKEAKGQFGME
jgi:ribonucleoside-diphosphate reductase alpha chain